MAKINITLLNIATIILIFSIITTIFIIQKSENLQFGNNFCINNGYQKLTDYILDSGIGDFYFECDNNQIFYYNVYYKCTNYKINGQCTKNKRAYKILKINKTTYIN